MEQSETRVFLVDDHATIRQAISYVFSREPGFEISGEAGTLKEARGFEGEFDVAVVDLGLPDGSGLDLIRDLRRSNPGCIILVLSSNPDRLVFARAVEAGASGFLHKSAALEDILEAVRKLGSGETLLSTEEVIEMLRLASAEREDEFRRRELVEQLTRREREVLQALADGLNDRQIAQRLHVSFETERTHMSHILAKTGVDSRLQALVMAARCGLVKIRQD